MKKANFAKRISSYFGRPGELDRPVHDVGKPLEIVALPSSDGLRTREEIYDWISRCIPLFKEWYQPVDFGNGVIAHQTLPPDWNPKPELLNDVGGGMAKWRYIVQPHIPNVAGMRVLDLGCSSGLFSIELARMGARQVIGIDRDTGIRHRSSATPPPQDVVAQANFVKRAFELLDGTPYPISYIAHDIGQIDKLSLGKFDLIIALCVVYHELEAMPVLLRRLANMTNHIILQANEVHRGDLGKYSCVTSHFGILFDLGFTKLEVDAPKGYLLPLIVGRK